MTNPNGGDMGEREGAVFAVLREQIVKQGAGLRCRQCGMWAKRIDFGDRHAGSDCWLARALDAGTPGRREQS